MRNFATFLVFAFALAGATPDRSDLSLVKKAYPKVRWDTAARRADFDCDGAEDSAFLGHEPGAVYVAVVPARTRKPVVLRFAVSAEVQQAICAEPAALEIESLDYDASAAADGDVEGFVRSRTCRGLDLSGGRCDNVHLFWNHKTKTLDWWRL